MIATAQPHTNSEQKVAEGCRQLMRVRDLRKSFGGQLVLGGVSLDLHEGEVVLLRGDNGAGKTTLLNILTGNLEPDSGSVWLDADGTEEDFRFPFRWWQELNPFKHFTPERVANEAVGRTWQDVRLFGTANLLDNVAVATPRQPGEKPGMVLMRNRAVRRFETTNRNECRQLLARIGLEDRASSSADKISLGQSRRVAITRAIRAGARILFLDEPLSGLDGLGIEEIMLLLSDLVERDRVTLVIVEHVFNIPRILRLAKTMWTLQGGKIQVESAASAPASASSGSDAITRKLIDQFSGPDRQVRQYLLQGGAKLIRISRRPSTQRAEAELLKVRSAVVYRGNRLVIGLQAKDGTVDGLSFTIDKGDMAILCAPNGWGKTTLLESLAGVIAMEQGEVLLRGLDSRRLPAWKRSRLGLRFIPARNGLFPSLSVADFLVLSHKQLPSDDRFPDSDRLIGELSGGERQQVALTELLEPEALAILDEPFLGLDSEAVTGICRRLENFISNLGGSILIALPAALEYGAS